MDVRMPDGTIIKDVPEGITRSQLQARVDKLNRPDTYNETGVSQGLSGINEGIAGVAGAPVDLANTALSMGAKGINAVAGTKLKTSDKPFLGSDWFKRNVLAPTIGAESTDPSNRFIRRVGQSVGAAAVPIAGTVGPSAAAARAFVPAVTGGVGAAVAKDIAPNNPWAEMGGDLLGSLLGGGISLASAKRAAGRKTAASVPTIPQLKQQASDMYTLAERNGVKASQQQTTDLYNQISDIAKQEGLISPTGRVSEAYPKAKEALNLAEDYAKGDMTPKQMQTVRKVLSEAAGGNDPSEQRIARQMLQAFDDWTAPLAPELAKARGIARRYISADKLETARELAGADAKKFSGSGFENALRTRYRGLDHQIIKGQEHFAPDVTDAIRRVTRGTPASNAARQVGKLAPTGVVSGSASIGVPFAIGNAIGGPGLGGALSAATSSAGLASRALATRMGLRAADMAELIARNGGKLPEAMVFTPEVQRLIAANSAAQASKYLSNQKKKRN
jgi:hypothetical protein